MRDWVEIEQSIPFFWLVSRWNVMTSGGASGRWAVEESDACIWLRVAEGYFVVVELVFIPSHAIAFFLH